MPDHKFVCKSHADEKIRYFDRISKAFCCSLCIFDNIRDEIQISKKTAKICTDEEIVKHCEKLS